ncbi:head GIN domain-containing protein [Shivajiella indica]|uniref:Head GIN domain-containing protein n=1 Tax=Shivajiella indica TaxID=872115 RepID=A0ABW5BA77_9BACT
MNALIRLFLFLFLISTLEVNAQTRTETRRLGSFDAVKVSNSIKAELIRGNENKIEITGSGIELEKVETAVADGTLEIKLARGNYKSHNVNVVVTYIDIQGIEATTSATVIAKNQIVAEEAYLYATTSSYLEADIDAIVLNVEAATNAKIHVSGKVNSLGLRAFTSAEIDGMKLVADKVEVLANTAATLYFGAIDSIDGSVATAAKVLYIGNPRSINVKTGTGGNISKN